MKKGKKKKQHEALKKRAESKPARQQPPATPSGPLQFIRQIFNRGGGTEPATPSQFIRLARNYPIEGCWVRRGWDTDGMAVVVIARRQPIEYAAQFGFQPHRDFKLAQNVLDPPDAHPRTGKVEFGKDGKPFYIAGPHDNVNAILRQLARTAGKDRPI